MSTKNGRDCRIIRNIANCVAEHYWEMLDDEEKEETRTIETAQQEPPEVDLEKETDQWRHKHFKGKRDGDYSGEYLERESQLDLARHFYELGLNARREE